MHWRCLACLCVLFAAGCGDDTPTSPTETSSTPTAASPTITEQFDGVIPVVKGEGCGETESIETLPALVSQFSTTLESGIHCVNIADTGDLPGAAIFLIRFSHY